MGPLIAEPFLSIQHIPEMQNSSSLNRANVSNSVEIDKQHLTIFLLFPILGSISCIVSIWYLFYDIIERIRKRIGPKDIDLSEGKRTDVKSLQEKQNLNSVYSWAFLGIMMLFFISYVGIEASLSSLMTAFSVNSDLNLTQQEGTIITSYFWAVFATTRLLYIFVPNRISSVQGICTSLFVISHSNLS